MGTLARREREKLQRRSDILAAAEELFDERGFEATTIDGIARRTELSKGTIYLYFKSKDDLFLAVCLTGIAGFREHLETAVAGKRGVEGKIKAIYRAYIDYFVNVPHIFRTLQDTFTERLRSNLSPESIGHINRLISEALAFGGGFVKEGIDSGLFRKDVDPYAFSLVAWRLATGLIELAVLEDPGVIDAGAVKRMFDKSITLLIDGLKAGGRRRALP